MTEKFIRSKIHSSPTKTGSGFTTECYSSTCCMTTSRFRGMLPFPLEIGEAQEPETSGKVFSGLYMFTQTTGLACVQLPTMCTHVQLLKKSWPEWLWSITDTLGTWYIFTQEWFKACLFNWGFTHLCLGAFYTWDSLQWHQAGKCLKVKMTCQFTYLFLYSWWPTVHNYNCLIDNAVIVISNEI